MNVRLTPLEIDRFWETGFLDLQQITTADEVARILELYDKLFARRAGWEKGDFFDFAGTDDAAAPPALPQLNSPSKYEPALVSTLFRINALAVAKQLLGPTAELVFEHAMMKPALTGGETPWHQDEAFFPKFTNYQSITIWMPLQPVERLNGCMEFIPGSHKEALLPHRPLNNDPRIHGLEAIGPDASRAVLCPLPAGGATIHHYRTLHHAGPNRSDAPRRAYALGFGVRSRKTVLTHDFSWNVERATLRAARARAAEGVMRRTANRVKSSVKALLW